MYRISFVAAVIMTLALPTVASSADRLSGEQIKLQLTNQPFIYIGRENGQHKEGRIVYDKSGQLFILTWQGYRDGGTWRVRNNKMCTRVTLGRGGAEKCFSIKRNADGSYSTSHNYKLYLVDDDRYKGA